MAQDCGPLDDKHELTPQIFTDEALEGLDEYLATVLKTVLGRPLVSCSGAALDFKSTILGPTDKVLDKVARFVQSDIDLAKLKFEEGFAAIRLAQDRLTAYRDGDKSRYRQTLLAEVNLYASKQTHKFLLEMCEWAEKLQDRSVPQHWDGFYIDLNFKDSYSEIDIKDLDEEGLVHSKNLNIEERDSESEGRKMYPHKSSMESEEDSD